MFESLYYKFRSTQIGYFLFSSAVLVVNKISGYAIEKVRFKKSHGYKLNLKAPKSFNEKIIYKKLFHRSDLLTKVADKYKAREYVYNTLGNKGKEILIPLLYETKKPENIPFNELPKEYIIKANHNSGPPIIVHNGNLPMGKKEVITELKLQLNNPYAVHKYEWAYKNIERRIIIEELLLTESGKIPSDYKFFMFHGKCRLIQVDLDRNENYTKALYDSDWNYLDLKYNRTKGKEVEKPQNFDEMNTIAEKLSIDFDFIRVDLYEVKGKIYFGELTHYPISGHGKFTPTDFDYELGKYWKLDYK